MQKQMILLELSVLIGHTRPRAHVCHAKNRCAEPVQCVRQSQTEFPSLAIRTKHVNAIGTNLMNTCKRIGEHKPRNPKMELVD